MAAAMFGPRFGDVSADEPDAKTQAQTLFLEGRKDLDENKWDVGCPKLRRSLELFAVANSIFSVAQCDEREGRTATALEHWERGVVLVDDPKDPRTKVGKDRIAALEPLVPRIRIIVPPESAGATILLDGTALASGVLATPLRVDPGKHLFVVRANGRQDNRKEIDIAEKERTEFVAALGPVDTAGPGPTGTATVPPPPPPPPPMHPKKLAGFVVGGIGVAGLVAAAGTAITLQGLHEKGCPNCAELDKYQKYYIANTVNFGVGIVGVGVGLFLILTAPKSADANKPSAAIVPFVGPNGSGIGLSGRF